MATVIIEHSDVTRSGRLGVVLRDHGHRLRIIRAHAGEAIPTDLDDIDAVVTCGGPHDPDGSSGWIDAEMDLLRAAHAAALPIFGICFGCQVLARALGGTVGKLDGIEAGWHDVTLTPPGREDALYAGIPWSSSQVHWHRYHVTEVPDGARVLAKSARTGVQAWALGLRTYAVQYHPEADPATVYTWAEDNPEALREAGMSMDDLRKQTEQHDLEAARLAQRLFERVALVLMPQDRRFAGIAKDLHH